MGKKWVLCGLYYEEYQPLLEPYGVKIFEGYIQKDTLEHKLVEVQRYRTLRSELIQNKLTNLHRLGYSKRERFLVDVAEMNIRRQ